jgi:hypothetical protein
MLPLRGASLSNLVQELRFSGHEGCGGTGWHSCFWYLVHAPHLFDTPTAGDVTRHFRQLLESIVADPECAGRQLPL